MRKLIPLTIGAICVASVLLAVATSGHASHAINSTLHYSFSDSSCSTASRVDPVTVVFYNLATTDRVNQNIDAHTDLDAGASVNPQNFGVNGVCLGQTVDKSSCAIMACTRWHIRGLQSPVTHATYGSTTQSTPHHEDWVESVFNPGCNILGLFGNHAVDKGGVSSGMFSGFDQGREHIWDGFSAAGHTGELQYWGNTQEFPQCDGDLAGSNGYVRYIKISHGH